ncbi:hypothetical protein PFISCL1PPCAC_17163, partial [Pristionchus fissidentatus]
NEVLFGFRYEYDKCDDLVGYVEGFGEMIKEIASDKLLMLAIAFPAIKYIPILNYYALGRHADRVKRNNQYIINNVARALETYDADTEPSNFVHAYNQRMPANPYLDKDNLIATCIDFFSAGQETTTTTLRWAMLFMADNQEVQDKLREEIHRVVGKDRLPALADKPKMLYTQATVLELQRRANILRMNVFRKTHADTELDGQPIPADTAIHADLHYVLWNDPLFVNPMEFRPERYIDEEAKGLRKDLVERTIPFSLGKRACAGEGLARVELFLGLAATVQHYRILPRPGQTINLNQQKQAFGLPYEQSLRLESVL